VRPSSAAHPTHGKVTSAPYQDVLPYLGVIEGVSTAFLDRSVRARRAASRRRTAGDVTDESCLLSDP